MEAWTKVPVLKVVKSSLVLDFTRVHAPVLIPITPTPHRPVLTMISGCSLAQSSSNTHRHTGY